ncbi:MAG: class I SAM-dependent methyltransferase [Deltaproteobacteria bacterium]|nr:class I SAM-dependent methyltransferase [Deltaproteobacteria bacterium]
MHDEKHAADHSEETDVWDDETAEQYIAKWGKDPTNRMTIEAAGLGPEDVVVDVGCGGGEAVRVAAECAVRGRALGVDPSPGMIRIATEQTRDHACADRIQFIEGPAEKLPLESGSANVVLAINSLHHWARPEVGLEEVWRVLAPGGRFWIGDEETENGGWSHAEGDLSDPAKIQHLVESHGFESVITSRRTNTDDVLLLMESTKPAR